MKILNAKSYEERDEIAKGDELLMDLNKWLKDYCQEGDEKYLNDVYWNERIQRLEGKKEEKREIAKSMLLETSDLEFISRVTKLSIEEIMNLQNEN